MTDWRQNIKVQNRESVSVREKLLPKLEKTRSNRPDSYLESLKSQDIYAIRSKAMVVSE